MADILEAAGREAGGTRSILRLIRSSPTTSPETSALRAEVVVVASLNEDTFYNRSYRLGFPVAGHWNEVFNSDVYDQWFNPNAEGNLGGISANGPQWDGLPTSAEITLPANSILVFARDFGDF
jgi:1,4-alpha-glucan branching enzyme